MKIGRLNTILLSLGIIVLGANFEAFGGDFAASEKPDLVQWYENSFETEEKELRTELLTMVDVRNQTAWNKAKSSFDADYEQACKTSTASELSHKPLPEKLLEAIDDLLAHKAVHTALNIARIERAPDNQFVKIIRFGLPAITIACGNETIEADAATDRYTILLDPEIVLATHANSAEIQATIAHEFVHILNDDDFHVFCFDQLCQEKRHRPRKGFKKVMNRWERLHERRADILSGLFDPTYAQAHTAHFLRNMPKKEEKATTHPTFRQRYEYMANLVKTIEQNETRPPLGIALFLFLALIALAAFSAIGSRKKVSRLAKN